MPPTNQPASVVRLQIGHGSDPGRQRSLNEDCYGIAASQALGRALPRGYWHVVDKRLLDERGQLFVVADGMGGHNAGELASSLAVQAILRAYYSLPFVDPATSLQQAIAAANREIMARAQGGDGAVADMGTTATALVVRGHQATVAHLGDSRCYLVTAGEVSAVTQDHTWVREQMQAGVLSEEEAQRHPYRHVLSRSLGRGDGQPDVLPALGLASGDRLVLCSDGLSNQVAPHELHGIVVSQPPQAAVEQLLALANQRGGPDNITAVVVQVEQMAGAAAGGVLAGAAQAKAAPPRAWLAAGALAVAALACAALFAINGLTGNEAQPTSPQDETPTVAPVALQSTAELLQPTNPEQAASPTPTWTPTLTPTLSPLPAEVAAEEVICVYNVQGPDTLEKIAGRFGLSVEQIESYNGGRLVLFRRQIISFPVKSDDVDSGRIHIVKINETLSEIALKYDVADYMDIAKENDLDDPGVIKEGHCLVIPR